MPARRRNLFLYLTLVCFLSIIAIFIVDGYLGIYDTVNIAAGEQTQTVEPDFWLSQGRPRPDMFWSTGVTWGEKAFFSYEVDNRQFSNYTAQVEVSIWQSQQKVRDLLSQPVALGSFGKTKLEWVVDTAELVPEGVTPDRSYQYTVNIKRGDIERKVLIYVNPTVFPPKPVPAPIIPPPTR